MAGERTERAGTLVLKDTAGDYFLVPLETLERGRVPAERRPEIERLISEHQGDVQGHAMTMAGIYQAWADQGNFLKSLSDGVGRPGPSGDVSSTRSPPSGAP